MHVSRVLVIVVRLIPNILGPKLCPEGTAFISGGIFERNENVKPIMAKLGQNMVPLIFGRILDTCQMNLIVASGTKFRLFMNHTYYRKYARSKTD
jgi:hypothetical protein